MKTYIHTCIADFHAAVVEAVKAKRAHVRVPLECELSMHWDNWCSVEDCAQEWLNYLDSNP